jgi:hypothetical protein
MTELKFDHPVEDLIAEEDAQTLLAIDQGIAQLDAGQGIPLSELRAELAKRCAKTDSKPVALAVLPPVHFVGGERE